MKEGFYICLTESPNLLLTVYSGASVVLFVLPCVLCVTCFLKYNQGLHFNNSSSSVNCYYIPVFSLMLKKFPFKFFGVLSSTLKCYNNFNLISDYFPVTALRFRFSAIPSGARAGRTLNRITCRPNSMQMRILRCP